MRSSWLPCPCHPSETDSLFPALVPQLCLLHHKWMHVAFFPQVSPTPTMCLTPSYPGREAGPGCRQAQRVGSWSSLGAQNPDSQSHRSASQAPGANHPRDPHEVTAGTGCPSRANILPPGSQPGILGRAGMGPWAVGLPATGVGPYVCLCTSRCALLACVCLGLSVALGLTRVSVWLGGICRVCLSLDVPRRAFLVFCVSVCPCGTVSLV